METKKLPPFIKILILTLITALLWVFFTIYRSFTAEPPVPVSSEIILPLNPKLDQKTIEEIKGKKYLDHITEISIEEKGISEDVEDKVDEVIEEEIENVEES